MLGQQLLSGITVPGEGGAGGSQWPRPTPRGPAPAGLSLQPGARVLRAGRTTGCFQRAAPRWRGGRPR